MGRRAQNARRGAAPSLTRLTLPEYTPVRLRSSDLPEATARRIWQRYGAQIQVEFPSPATADQWQLTAQGWAGVIRPSADLQLELTPRVPVGDLLRWLAYAHDLASYHLLDHIASSATLPAWYGHLASLLAARANALIQRGLTPGYVARAGESAYLRGRLDVAKLQQRMPTQTLPCRYSALSANIPENQLIAAALQAIQCGGLCPPATAPLIRHITLQLTQAGVTVPADLPSILYHSSNAHYRPLHALCRMFLAQRGPAWGAGDDETVPFLVHMPRLFEACVARWLKRHAPPGCIVRAQEHVPLAPSDLTFIADLTLTDTVTGQPQVVLDTKYTHAPRPATADVAQVAAYAQLLGCQRAYLVYPVPLAQPLDVLIGKIQVRSAVFPLEAAIEDAGWHLLQMIGGAGG